MLSISLQKEMLIMADAFYHPEHLINCSKILRYAQDDNWRIHVPR